MELIKKIFNFIIKQDLVSLEESLTQVSDINSLADEDGMTPLMLACLLRDIKTAAFLVSRGAGLNFQDKDGFSPLMWAAQDGYLEIVDLLLSHGADPALESHQGWSALDLARTSQHFAVEAKILKACQAMDAKK